MTRSAQPRHTWTDKSARTPRRGPGRDTPTIRPRRELGGLGGRPDRGGGRRRDGDLPRRGAYVRARDAHGQNARVVARRHRVGGDVGRQAEAAAEGAVADLAQAAAVALLRALVAALAADDQGVVLDLDRDVLLDVDARQLQPYDRLVTVAGDFRAGG
jgi:hypothetical protein